MTLFSPWSQGRQRAQEMKSYWEPLGIISKWCAAFLATIKCHCRRVSWQQLPVDDGRLTVVRRVTVWTLILKKDEVKRMKIEFQERDSVVYNFRCLSRSFVASIFAFVHQTSRPRQVPDSLSTARHTQPIEQSRDLETGDLEIADSSCAKRDSYADN